MDSAASRDHAWPDDRPISGAGFARVDTKISCILTRFRLRSPLLLLPFYISFRRVRRAARSVEGLLQALFLVESPHICYTLSVWRNERSILEFGRLHEHVKVANSSFRPTYRRDLGRSEIWSAQFRLWAVSCHNLSWEGFDMKGLLADQWKRREDAQNLGDSGVAIHVG
jgi:hypothetical protein